MSIQEDIREILFVSSVIFEIQAGEKLMRIRMESIPSTNEMGSMRNMNSSAPGIVWISLRIANESQRAQRKAIGMIQI